MHCCKGPRVLRRTGLRSGLDHTGPPPRSVVLVLVLVGSLLVSVDGYLAEDQEELLVELHNRYRGVVQPSASAMLPLKWDPNLKLLAEGYAAKCIWNHNTNLEDVGENLFVATGSLNLEQAMEKWFLEHLDYNYYNNSCDEDRMCGHYTQMVWADTHRVGCAFHLCNQMEGLAWEQVNFLVCNYYPAGNYENEHPYIEGNWCSQCPENLPSCQNNLCVSDEEPEEDEDTPAPTKQVPYPEPRPGSDQNQDQEEENTSEPDKTLDHEQDHDQTLDHVQPSDHAQEHVQDQTSDHEQEHVHVQTSDHAQEHVQDQTSDHEQEHVQDKTSDHEQKHVQDQTSDHEQEHVQDKTSDHEQEHVRDKTSDHEQEHVQDKTSDHEQEHVRDKASDHEQEHVQDKTSDHEHDHDQTLDHVQPSDHAQEHVQDQTSDHEQEAVVPPAATESIVPERPSAASEPEASPDQGPESPTEGPTAAEETKAPPPRPQAPPILIQTPPPPPQAPLGKRTRGLTVQSKSTMSTMSWSLLLIWICLYCL